MPREGEIIIVRDMLDPNGANPKDRPCVVVTRDEDLDAGATVVVMAGRPQQEGEWPLTGSAEDPAAHSRRRIDRMPEALIRRDLASIA